MQAETADRPAVKPHLIRLTMPDGAVKFYGLPKAAKFLGCTYQALHMAVHGKPGRGARLLERARAEWPEAFADESEKVAG